MSSDYDKKSEALLRILPHYRDFNPNDGEIPSELRRDSKGVIRGADNIAYARWQFGSGGDRQVWYTPDANSAEFITAARQMPLNLAAAILSPPKDEPPTTSSASTQPSEITDKPLSIAGRLKNSLSNLKKQLRL